MAIITQHICDRCKQEVDRRDFWNITIIVSQFPGLPTPRDCAQGHNNRRLQLCRECLEELELEPTSQQTFGGMSLEEKLNKIRKEVRRKKS